MPESTQKEILSLVLPDEASTELLGKHLAEAVLKHRKEITDRGLNIRLQGTLGAGKTTLTRALLRALGFTGRVRSPTFTLVETYSVQGLAINHFDFYRFESPEEFEEAGFRDLFGAGRLTLCEWPDKAKPFLPPADLLIHIDLKGDGREAKLCPENEWGGIVAKEVEESWQ